MKKHVVVSVASFSAGVFAMVLITKKILLPQVALTIGEKMSDAITNSVDEENQVRLLAEMQAIIFADQVENYSRNGKG